MKTFLLSASLTLGLLLQAAAASGAIETAPLDKLYTFKFKMSQETYEYSQRSNSYEEAFERAAQACFNHYRGGRRVSEDRGLDIIDVCANPRS